MPCVNIQITRGASRDQKAQLVRVLGKKPEHPHVEIQDIAEEDWGDAGLLTDDWPRQQAG